MKNFGIATISMIILLGVGGCNEQKTENIDKLNSSAPLKPDNGEFRDPGQRCHTSIEGFELQQLDGDWTKDLSKGADGPWWTEDHVEISYSECQFASWTRSGANSVAGYWYPRGNNVVLETFYAEEFDLWKDVRMKGKDSIIFLDPDGHKVFLRRMEEAEELPVAQ